ncbi:uncharacterized protein VTP21DRAFT_3236 [Calcarisporiella thermophila]|uniref:uncharacterized protein n=1 Tax=Calcarisporiella thermophila TaxID=911321 RepID=UPI00374355F3
MQEGYHDFIVLDRGHDVGGTWRDNCYPGASSDVPGDLYSYSFALNPEWTCNYPAQPETLDYMRYCAAKYGVYPHCKFGHEIQKVAWNEMRQIWEVGSSRGMYTCKIMIFAMGVLTAPVYPKFQGLDEFSKTEGNKVFHSSRWDYSHNLRGRKVAVIGTGASAIQIIPAIQPQVGKLLVMQRTPHWIVPRYNAKRSRLLKWLYRNIPGVQMLVRNMWYWLFELVVLPMVYHYKYMAPFQVLSTIPMRMQIKDSKLRTKLTPNYLIGCKRILFHTEYYRTMTEPNVSLITDKIEKFEPHHLVTENGVRHEVDTVVLATGFRAPDQPFAHIVYGRGGKLMTEAWRDNMSAYNGTTVPGFPNAFILLGPNTWLGQNSILIMIESQINYVIHALKYMAENHLNTIEVSEKALAEYDEMIAKKQRNSVWTKGGCNSYYLDSKGRSPINWPDFVYTFYRRTRRFDAENYDSMPHKISG